MATATELDRLNGRAVQTIGDTGDGGWRISFEGDIILTNNDVNVTVPGNEIIGTVLMSSTADDDPILDFGYSGEAGSQLVSQITLTKDQYELASPGSTPDQPVELPPDPSAERVADGPEGA